MRDFLVRSLNKIIWIVFFVILIASAIGGLIAFFKTPILGIAIMVGGLILATFSAGLFFLATGLYELAIGIYNNTQRTAAALEALAGASQPE
ncbi:MAG: hypothetical protein EBT13_07540 [Rhodobacteraceae bacterium]|jgi:hypothetical protein|nr:hypothetical protein [Paracoccaceae bacterium]